VTSGREEKIRERAYAIWLDQGSIDGRDQEHWLEAEKEIAREGATAEPKGDAAVASKKKS
jgi:Protein of unknown function (DUF2934)